jgi:sigma-E factor negative regulatory protein RseC
MIEERALVLETKYDVANLSQRIARVKVQRTNACESCSLKSGCGQSALSKLSSSQCLEIDVDNSLDAEPGDEVLIAIPEAGLMSASLNVYFVPLLLMIVGAVLGSVLDSYAVELSEFWTMSLALLGLIIGFIAARFFGQRKKYDHNFLPKMTKKIINPI